MEENNPYLGIDCNDTGTNDMREQNVFETFLSKRQQLFLATQVRRGIRKRDFLSVRVRGLIPPTHTTQTGPQIE